MGQPVVVVVVLGLKHLWVMALIRIIFGTKDQH
jgi:hypothetical protein